MALRNQPYMPLFIQDYLTDEKLNECCAASQGVYIKIMCLMHKSNDYGTIIIKDQHKVSKNKYENFAYKISKHLSFTKEEIQSALKELIREKVLQISGNILSQKRMISDNKLSLVRATSSQKKLKTKDFVGTKALTNTEYEYETEIDINSSINKKEVKEYFEFQGSPEFADDFFDYYEAQGWVTAAGRPIKNWQSKANTWIKKELNKPKENKYDKIQRGTIDIDKYKRELATIKPRRA